MIDTMVKLGFDQISSNIVFQVSDKIELSRWCDGYYNFRNVKKITFRNGTCEDVSIFDKEVLLVCAGMWDNFFIYPIDPKLPMSADVVVFSHDKRQCFTTSGCWSAGEVIYEYGVISGIRNDLPKNEILKLF